MYVYDHEFESNNILFIAGKMTTHSKLGIFINLEDKEILNLMNTDPQKLADCLKQITPFVLLQDAHHEIFNIADGNGYYGHGYNQWEDYFGSLNFNRLSELKLKAEMVLKNSEDCDPKAVSNAKTVLECLNGNFPPRHVKVKSPEEKAKAKFERDKSKLRLKITIERGYKCDCCGNSQENKLCIVRKDSSLLNYEIDNLVLRCRACINKMKRNK